MKPNVTREYAKDRIFNMLEKDDLREYIVKDGVKVLKHGHWEYLHDSGALASKGTFIDGLPQGFWQFFHENGQISQRGVYIDGARFHGDDEDAYLWKIYDKDGKELYTSLDDMEANDNWIEEAEDYLAAQKKRWSWIHVGED